MTRFERCLSVLENRIPDRVPVVPENYAFCVKHCGYKMKDVRHDGNLLAECLIRTLEDFGYDGVTVDLDNAASAEALGCRVDFSEEDNPAIVSGPAIESLEEVKDLKIPEPYKDGRLHVYIECTRRLAREIGKDAFIYAFFDQGPFSLAAMVRGIENFMLDLAMRENLELIHQLIDFCRQAGEIFGKALIDAGAHVVGIGDALASPDVISPRQYEEFAFPYERRMAENIQKEGGRFGIHICGNVTPILPKLVQTGAVLLDIDYKADLKEVKRICRGKVAVRGPIEPSSVMCFGTQKVVEEKCREAIEILGKNGGFILSSGCDIMKGTPPENMAAMVQAALKYGHYQISERR